MRPSFHHLFVVPASRLALALWIVLVGALGAGALPPIRAVRAAPPPVEAWTITSFTPESSLNFFIGIEFVVASPKTVTELGVMDGDNDGSLDTPTGVGIYQVAAGCCAAKPGAHIVSVVIPAGTSPTTIGALSAFYMDVPDVVLAPGNYVVAAEAGLAPLEPFGSTGTSLSFASGLSYMNGWHGGLGSSFPGVGNNYTFTSQSNSALLTWPSGTFRLAPQIDVTTTDDELNIPVGDGDCSLREAVQAANTDTVVDACPAGSGDDTVNIPAGTYLLTLTGSAEDGNATGDLDLAADLTLQGAGAPNTFIDGNSADRVFHVTTGGFNPTFQDLTV